MNIFKHLLSAAIITASVIGLPAQATPAAFEPTSVSGGNCVFDNILGTTAIQYFDVGNCAKQSGNNLSSSVSLEGYAQAPGFAIGTILGYIEGGTFFQDGLQVGNTNKDFLDPGITNPNATGSYGFTVEFASTPASDFLIGLQSGATNFSFTFGALPAAAVPEPFTLFIFLGGLASAAALRRRRFI